MLCKYLTTDKCAKFGLNKACPYMPYSYTQCIEAKPAKEVATRTKGG
jgi:hypothetical protein